jgi:cellobiose-specific phosphotransferase system component IIC
MADSTRPTPPGDQTLGGLVATAFMDVTTLVRGTIELAKSELRADARRAVVGGALLGAVAFLGIFIVIMLSIAAAYGLVALGLAPGWAFLIIAGAYLLVALILALVGTAMLRRIRPPERTIRMAKEIPQALRPPG